MREAWQVGQRRLTDLSKVLETVEVEARVLRLRGQSSDPWRAYLHSSSKPDSKQCSRRKQYVGMQAHACQFPPVPAGGIDSELSSLSGGMRKTSRHRGCERR